MPWSGRSGDVRITGERVQHHHYVVPRRRQLAPALDGDTDVVDHRTAFGRQRTDVDIADLAFSGQRLGGHVGDRHVICPLSFRSPQQAATDCGSLLHLRAAAKPSSRSARMSSMPSMPTASRTSPGLTPVAELLLGAQLSVGGRCRVNHQGAHVADVGDVTVQFERVHERLAGLNTAGQLERQNSSGSLGCQLLCPLVPRRTGQPRVVDGQHPFMAGQDTRRPAARWRRAARCAGSASPGLGPPGTR